jgi:hypothetical protein
MVWFGLMKIGQSYYFKGGLKVGSKGGHERIRYTILNFIEGESVRFRFSKPEGFNGTYELKIIELL